MISLYILEMLEDLEKEQKANEELGFGLDKFYKFNKVFLGSL